MICMSAQIAQVTVKCNSVQQHRCAQWSMYSQTIDLQDIAGLSAGAVNGYENISEPYCLQQATGICHEQLDHAKLRPEKCG